MKRAIFPGSFDPLTKGHEALVKRGLELFDEIIVAIGTNANKKYLFSLEERIDFIQKTFHNRFFILLNHLIFLQSVYQAEQNH